MEFEKTYVECKESYVKCQRLYGSSLVIEFKES